MRSKELLKSFLLSMKLSSRKETMTLIGHRMSSIASTQGAHRPIRQTLRRHPFKYLDVIDKQVDEIKAHGIIEPAAIPWKSNVVLVRKKDNSLRFCIDYRQLNSVTVQDSYPIPLIDNCLNAL